MREVANFWPNAYLAEASASLFREYFNFDTSTNYEYELNGAGDTLYFGRAT